MRIDNLRIVNSYSGAFDDYTFAQYTCPANLGKKATHKFLLYSTHSNAPKQIAEVAE